MCFGGMNVTSHQIIPDSNELMARSAWLDRVDIPAANIHAMPTLDGDPAVSCAKYEQHLQEFFHTSPGEFPSLDVILLGIGDDAHTASLFPHTEALKIRDRLITVGNKDGNPRITFTYPFINASNCVMFLVTGSNKRPALAQIFADSADEFTYPSRLIQPPRGTLVAARCCCGFGTQTESAYVTVVIVKI